MDTRYTRFVGALAATALLLACSQSVDTFKVQHDASKASAGGENKVADAQVYLDLVNSQYNSDIVNARVRARANDPRNASTAAINNADARRLRAEASQKIADAQYAVDKARAEASYNLAKAQCAVHADAASNSCRNDATTNYDSEMAAAKAREDGMHRQVANSG